MKQLIVINTETANKCQVGSGGFLRAPPFPFSKSVASFIVLLGSLGGGHHCGKSLAGFRLVYCDREERSLAGSLLLSVS